MQTLVSKYLIILFTLFVCPILVLGQIQDQLEWKDLPPLPDKVGFSGMFAGVSNDALICVGGANTSQKNTLQNGVKKWYDRIYVLERNSLVWRIAKEKLPVPLAYGVSMSYKNNIIIVGGSDGNQHYSRVYNLQYKNGNLKIDTLVSLPFPLANMSGSLVGDVLFIAGGNTKPEASPGKYFLALDLARDAANQRWLTLESWPGPERMQAVSASLNNSFFLFSGFGKYEKFDGTYKGSILTDAYRFTPKYDGVSLKGGSWKILSNLPRGVAAGANPAPTFGSGHILFPGGLDSIADNNEDHALSLQLVPNLLAYHIGSNSWLNFGDLPKSEITINAPVVKWGDNWVIPNGKLSTGIESPKVFTLSKVLNFGWINWAMLIFYLGLMIWIGIIFDKREQTTKNFFTASGKIPWWAAGVSIYGAQFSAISFMALPAIVYSTDWSLAIGSIMVLGTVPLVIKFYIPFFRRLSITSAYEYLEFRFNANIRIIASLSFILFQLCRMGVVLFLPAIAVSSVTGIDVYLIISIMGIICILYTVMGGIEAVIWTDVVQVIILFGGAILCLVIGVLGVEGGLSGVIAKGMEDHKFTMFHLGWEPNKLVLWVGIVGFFFLNLIPYTSEQTIVQRYLTVKDEEATAKSLWTNAILTLPTIIIFFGLGTVLYVFYNENSMIIPSEQVGEILPYFVVTELPAGIAGLIIAGIFAASQSTLSGGMNSIAAAFVIDIYPRFRVQSLDRNNLRMARLVTIIVGIFGIGTAMLVAALNVQFIFDLFQEILGVVGGTLAGVFILGIFTNRANALGVISGIIVGVFSVWLTKNYTDISVYLYGAISVVTTVIVGYFISFFTRQKKDLKGLTYLSLDKKTKTEF